MRFLSHLRLESRVDIAVTRLSMRKSVDRGGAGGVGTLRSSLSSGHALPTKLQKSVIPALRQAQDRLAFGQAGIQALVII
jgi:hypothetical protein